jgi:hypothetical protein
MRLSAISWGLKTKRAHIGNDGVGLRQLLCRNTPARASIQGPELILSGILHPTELSVEGSLNPAEELVPPWPLALKHAIRSGLALCERLEIDPSDIAEEAEEDFPVFVPLEYIQRIEPRSPTDPLLRQVISSQLELNSEGQDDPVGDALSEATPGLLHKYKGRVLSGRLWSVCRPLSVLLSPELSILARPKWP